jgi:hypothetical protein
MAVLYLFLDFLESLGAEPLTTKHDTRIWRILRMSLRGPARNINRLADLLPTVRGTRVYSGHHGVDLGGTAGRNIAGNILQLPKAEVNCSICDKPVTLETAKTEEFGRAVHDECYLLKVGIKTASGIVRGPEQMQNVTFSPTPQRQDGIF